MGITVQNMIAEKLALTAETKYGDRDGETIIIPRAYGTDEAHNYFLCRSYTVGVRLQVDVDALKGRDKDKRTCECCEKVKVGKTWAWWSTSRRHHCRMCEKVICRYG